MHLVLKKWRLWNHIIFIILVSCGAPYDHKESSPLTCVDNTLDCVPVRQPRASQNQSRLPLFKKPCIPKEILDVSSKVHEKSYTKLIPTAFAHKAYLTSSKPADLLLKNLQQSSLRLMSEDTEGSDNNSFSVSKIADYLGKILIISIRNF